MQIKQGKGSEGGKKKNKKQNTHVLCSSRPASLLVQCLFSFFNTAAALQLCGKQGGNMLAHLWET